MKKKQKKTYLPLLIILAVVAVTAAVALWLYQSHRTRLARPMTAEANGKPGAQPPHVRGNASAPVVLEEFGDFECMPCFILWPALRNLEKDYGERLAVIFRNNPMPQHKRALDGARAAEAAGLQGKFWEMHDMLYLQRNEWLRSLDVQSAFVEFAGRLKLDVERFKADIAGGEVARRVAADRERAGALALDRTPVVYINGKQAELQGDVEKGLKNDIDAALAKH